MLPAMIALIALTQVAQSINQLAAGKLDRCYEIDTEGLTLREANRLFRPVHPFLCHYPYWSHAWRRRRSCPVHVLQ